MHAQDSLISKCSKTATKTSPATCFVLQENLHRIETTNLVCIMVTITALKSFSTTWIIIRRLLQGKVNVCHWPLHQPI